MVSQLDAQRQPASVPEYIPPSYKLLVPQHSPQKPLSKEEIKNLLRRLNEQRLIKLPWCVERYMLDHHLYLEMEHWRLRLTHFSKRIPIRMKPPMDANESIHFIDPASWNTPTVNEFRTNLKYFFGPMDAKDITPEMRKFFQKYQAQMKAWHEAVRQQSVFVTPNYDHQKAAKAILNHQSSPVKRTAAAQGGNKPEVHLGRILPPEFRRGTYEKKDQCLRGSDFDMLFPNLQSLGQARSSRPGRNGRPRSTKGGSVPESMQSMQTQPTQFFYSDESSSSSNSPGEPLHISPASSSSEDEDMHGDTQENAKSSMAKFINHWQTLAQMWRDAAPFLGTTAEPAASEDSEESLSEGERPANVRGKQKVGDFPDVGVFASSSNSNRNNEDHPAASTWDKIYEIGMESMGVTTRITSDPNTGSQRSTNAWRRPAVKDIEDESHRRSSRHPRIEEVEERLDNTHVVNKHNNNHHDDRFRPQPFAEEVARDMGHDDLITFTPSTVDLSPGVANRGFTRDRPASAEYRHTHSSYFSSNPRSGNNERSNHQASGFRPNRENWLLSLAEGSEPVPFQSSHDVVWDTQSMSQLTREIMLFESWIWRVFIRPMFFLIALYNLSLLLSWLWKLRYHDGPPKTFWKEILPERSHSHAISSPSPGFNFPGFWIIAALWQRLAKNNDKGVPKMKRSDSDKLPEGVFYSSSEDGNERWLSAWQVELEKEQEWERMALELDAYVQERAEQEAEQKSKTERTRFYKPI